MDEGMEEQVRYVGLALLSKKLPRVLTRELEQLCAEHYGVALVPLEPHRPIQDQEPQRDTGNGRGGGAPFHAVLHKLHGDSVWESHLASYAARHPHLVVLDPPAAVHRTEDRQAMLQVLPEQGLRVRVPVQQQQQQQQREMQQEQQQQEQEQQQGEGEVPVREVLVCAPRQVTLGSRVQVQQLARGDEGCQPAGLRPPLLLKTRATDAGGGGGSGHGLAVVAGWGELELRAEEMQRAAGAGAGTVAAGGGAEDGRGEGAWVPLVAQEYLPHSSALYKVYVLGRHVCVHRRESLTLDVLERHKKRQQQGQEQQQDGKGCTGLGMPAPGLLSNISARPLLDKPDGSIGSSATAAAGGGAADGGKGSSIGPSEGGEGSGNRIGGDGSGGGGGGGGVSNAVLEAVAAELSGLLGLTMFNFDVVEPWEAEVGHHEGQDGGRKEQQDGEHGQLGGYAGRTAAAPAAAAAGRSHGLTEAGGCEGAAAGGGSSPHGAAVGPHVPCRTTLYVVDVNYFPGYDKLPGWEGMLAERLGRAVGRVAGKRAGELRVGAAEGGLDGCGVRNGGQRGTMPRGGEEAAAGGGSAAEEGPAAKGTRC